MSQQGNKLFFRNSLTEALKLNQVHSALIHHIEVTQGMWPTFYRGGSSVAALTAGCVRKNQGWLNTVASFNL